MAVQGSDATSSRLLGVIQTQTEIARMGVDLGGVMSLVAERAQALTHAAGAVIELAEGEDMVYRATAGIAEPYLGLRLRRQASLSGQCIFEGHPLRCDDAEADERVDREACRRIGLRSMIVVPLRHHDEVVGVLKVLATQPGALDADDQRVLELMSELIAAAMFHAARHENDELLHRATHDALTGLPNRALFFERLHGCLSRAMRGHHRFAVMNLDMDRLKPINDQWGHQAGDAAIREFAHRIRSGSRPGDLVARLGGDEFGVILPRAADHAAVQRHAERLATRIQAPFPFGGHALDLSASIGVAVYPDDATHLDTLLEFADRAMYANKRARQRDS